MVGRFSLLALLAVAVVAEVINAAPEQRITSGVAATASEFPYQVSLKINGFHVCSGAIISFKHIVTAAKCVNDVEIGDLEVVTGSFWSTDGGQTHLVKKIVVNPEFSPENPDANDIAVVVLKKWLKFDANQRMIMLPSQGTPGGVYATFTGWAELTGWVNSSAPAEVEHLKKVSMKTISTEKCQRDVPDVTLVDGHQICAAVETGLDDCRVYFDYGAPLVSNSVVVGVLSHDQFPCDKGTPSVFTSVQHHVKWILKVEAEK